MTKLIVAFRKFANAPEKERRIEGTEEEHLVLNAMLLKLVSPFFVV
jgi:hypothetical protein